MTHDLRDLNDYDPEDWENPACRPEEHVWIPSTDTASRTILESAILDLVAYGGGESEEASASLSLLAEGEAWLTEFVVDACDQCYAWSA